MCYKLRSSLYHKLLVKRNLYKFRKNLKKQLALLRMSSIREKQILEDLQGWFGYALWTNTYNFREMIKKEIINTSQNKTQPYEIISG